MNKKEKDLVTNEGMQELKAELEMRKTTKRLELREVVDDMRQKGDLSENDGYSLAVEDQASNEARIAELEELIEGSKIVNDCSATSVCLGSKVTVKNGVEKAYELVGEDQANPLEDKISYKSPLGTALMDKKVGDKVKVETPTGISEYTILKIS